MSVARPIFQTALFFFLASSLLVLPARADFTVQDPNGILKKLNDSFDAGPAFSQAFQCGQTAKDQGNITSCQVKCYDNYCSSKCDDDHQGQAVLFQLTVDECKPDQVYVFGDNGLNILVTATDYASAGNYWLLPFLKNIGQWIQPDGQVVLGDVMPFFATYLENGKKLNLKIQMIHGTIQFGSAAQGLGFELWLTPDLDGARQILLFRLGNDQVLLQNRGLILQ